MPLLIEELLIESEPPGAPRREAPDQPPAEPSLGARLQEAQALADRRARLKKD